MTDNNTPHITPFGPGVTVDGPTGIDVLGGKGINLLELTSAGFPVPPGFVVTTRAYLDFVAANNLAAEIESISKTVDVFNIVELEDASEKIRGLFTNAPIPPELGQAVSTAYELLKAKGQESVAVRSSATAEDLEDASFAGQQDTYLNIRGEEAVLNAVRSCWGSLWTARAMGYRAEKKIPFEGLALAVVVQQMVLSETAGIMFTANPLTGARDEILINAAWGLGEAIVGGQVTPDTITVDKNTFEVKEVQISEKTIVTVTTDTGTKEVELTGDQRQQQAMSNEDAQKLARIGKKVEEHYDGLQDIEWCLTGGELYLVQARPVTVIPPDPVVVEAVRQEEIKAAEKLAAKQNGARWAIYNLAETLKSPTPLTWDVIRRFMSGGGGFIEMYRDFGYFPSSLVDAEGIVELIGGKIYADLQRHAELFYNQWPQEYDPEEADDSTTMLEGPPTKFNFERAGASFLLKMPWYMFKMIMQGRRMRKMARRFLDTFENEVKPEFLKYVQKVKAVDLASMNDQQVLEEVEKREVGFNRIARESEKTSFIAGYYQGRLQGTLEDVMGIKEGQAYSARLLMGLEGDKTVEQNADLYKVAKGKMSLKDFLASYGHRCTGEFELSEPRWYEDSSFLEQQISFTSASSKNPIELHKAQKVDREKAVKDFGKVLTEHAASSLEEDLRVDIAGAQKYLPYRETSKYYYMMAYALLRDALQILASRWEIGNDLYFLRRTELSTYASDPAARQKLQEKAAERKTKWEAAQSLEMPDFLDSEDLQAIGRPIEIKASEDGTYVGKGVAAGSNFGKVRIVHSPKTAGHLGDDYVLVCSSTDPGWTPLFVNARGVIVERGGMLSHGAIVARDFGIPCVVLPNATRLLNDGAEIKLDGNRGTVEIISDVTAAVGKEG